MAHRLVESRAEWQPAPATADRALLRLLLDECLGRPEGPHQQHQPDRCYIDSRFTVPPEGTHVREICMTIPGGELSVHGTVLCPTPGVGFAVRFADMDDETQAALNNLVFARA
jgi:hypothetical protein